MGFSEHIDAMRFQLNWTEKLRLINCFIHCAANAQRRKLIHDIQQFTRQNCLALVLWTLAGRIDQVAWDSQKTQPKTWTLLRSLGLPPWANYRPCLWWNRRADVEELQPLSMQRALAQLFYRSPRAPLPVWSRVFHRQLLSISQVWRLQIDLLVQDRWWFSGEHWCNHVLLKAW